MPATVATGEVIEKERVRYFLGGFYHEKGNFCKFLCIARDQWNAPQKLYQLK